MLKIGVSDPVPRSPTMYRKLCSAINVANSPVDRIWTYDNLNRDGVIVKNCSVMSAKPFYDYLISDKNRKICWYEVINKHMPCCFYLDIELEKEIQISDNYLKSRILYTKSDISNIHVSQIIEDYRKLMKAN